MNWNTHVRNKTDASIKKLVMCQRAIGKSWGIHPRLAMWLYKAIIRPSLDYGSLMWIVGIKAKFKQVLLERVQRLVLLMITGATRTTPTAGMEVILRLPPIDIHLKEQAMRIWRRLIRTNAISFRNLNSGHVGWIRSHTRPVTLIEIPPIISDHVPKTNIGTHAQ